MQKQIIVFMLEDDKDDRYITETVLSELNIDVPISFFSDSDQFLRQLNDSALPDLILLDDNSTPENGLQVLKKIKSNNSIRHIPVVVLTDNRKPDHIKQCYAAGASSVAAKPATLKETTNKIKSFFQYWQYVAELPDAVQVF